MSSEISVVSRRFGDNNAKYQITFYTGNKCSAGEGSVNLSAWRSRGLLPGRRASSGVSVAQVSRQAAQLEDRLQAIAAAAHHPPGATPPNSGDRIFVTAASCWTTSTRRSWRWTPSGGAPGPAHHGPGLLRREPHRPLVNDFMVRFPSWR